MAESERCDLRMLSLLYGLGDQEELIREALRLLTEPGMDDATWIKVRNLGRCLASDHPLFSSGQSIAQIRNLFTIESDMQCDRRNGDRRVWQRRLVSDQRYEERRCTNLAWIGVDRRKAERRSSG